MRIDARIPVVINPAEPGPDDLVLEEGRDFVVPPGEDTVHPASCMCCTGRSPVAGLLGGLFFARARGTVPFFRRVAVRADTPDARRAVAVALETDPVVSGCFRPG